MAFFPRASFYGSQDPSFTPLFRLLDDFDTYARGTGTGNGHRHRSHLPSFTPRFDVRETDTAYELHGELAGMAKEDLSVEFIDPQTMMIRGHIERSYTAGTPPAGAIEGGGQPPASITEGGESHKATVRDEAEEKTVEEGTVEVAAKKPTDNAKYWISERSIGDFSRSFNFPHRVDQDGVTASLKDGILTVHVPKAKKHESRRIVNVH